MFFNENKVIMIIKDWINMLSYKVLMRFWIWKKMYRWINLYKYVMWFVVIKFLMICEEIKLYICMLWMFGLLLLWNEYIC